MPMPVAAGIALAESQRPATPAAPRIRKLSDYTGSGWMTPALDKLAAFVRENPTVFSGTWFEGKPAQFVVGVARPDDPAAEQFEALRRQLDPGGKTMKTVPARLSWAQLDGIRNQIMVEYMTATPLRIEGLGPDPVTDADLPLRDNPTVLAIAAKYGEAVMFGETSGTATAY